MRRIFLLLFFSIAIGAAAQEAGNHKTVWNGVYSQGQATRGRAEYTSKCAGCHEQDLEPGNESARFRGPNFMERWREYDLGSFFGFVKATMPRRNPGSLSDQQYVDIVAHILKENSFPAGSSELKTADLKNIQIEGKDGPKPLSSGALVQVVGCLAQGSSVWALTNATEPARTNTSDGSTEEELKTAKEKPLGTQLFRLANLGYLGPNFTIESYAGHKVHAKGYLVRQPNRERIEVTSLQSVAPVCEP